MLTCQVQEAVLHCHRDLWWDPYDHCIHPPILAWPLEFGRQLWCFCVRAQLLRTSLLLQLVCGLKLELCSLWQARLLLLQETHVLGPGGLQVLLWVCLMPEGAEASIKLPDAPMKQRVLRDACCSMQRTQQLLLKVL
jgi:hypothetical protein